MCLAIIPKLKLSDLQAQRVLDILSAPEHASDMGPIKFWHIYHQGLYAVIDVGSNQPIGIVEASGARGSVRPGWWLDKRVRGRGYGYKLVDTLALYLKSEGYTGVGPIDIQTHDEASRIASGKLADRFARHFGHK